MRRLPSLILPLVLGLSGANAALLPSTARANGAQTSPTANEITASEWRRQQLAAADRSDEIMHRAQKLPGLLAQYILMQSTYDANDQRAFRLIFGQYLSWFQTWIGDYDGARKSFSIAQPAQADDGPSPLAGGYRAQPADEVVLRLAHGRKAIFFNEAHSAPITRTLTVELLGRLRAEGFNYFAAETLYVGDKDLQKRGYAIAKSGFYVSEPIYGEMVRTALALGFKVVAYDAENAGVGDPREKEGAQTLAQIFKHDPNARLVVNAGFAHIQKQGKYLGGSSMAEFFERISGIEPLAIEQTMMIQHARADQDHPYYIAVTQANRAAHPFAYVNASGAAWTLKPGEYDVSVIFPPSTVVDGRPDWVSLDGTRVAYRVGGDACRANFPCLIEARHLAEGEDAVAADRAVLNVIDQNTPINERMLVNHGNTDSRLYLFPGSYRVSALDRVGRTLTSKTVEIVANDASRAAAR
ncbi:MAG: hypothetical protein ABI846_13930 [Rudaea sp.]